MQQRRESFGLSLAALGARAKRFAGPGERRGPRCCFDHAAGHGRRARLRPAGSAAVPTRSSRRDEDEELDGLLPDPSDPAYAQMTLARDRAARVCGTTTNAIRARLCGGADAARQWPFAYAECPVEGRQIHLRECLKPRVLIGEGGGGIARRSEAECSRPYETRTRSW